MKATQWEFTNRAMVFGLIFGCAFPLYALDQQNISAALANSVAERTSWNADLLARSLYVAAALLMALAALLRTWASSYLHASVVYASQVRSDALVADGPYRWVRNPLYFANILMAIALGALMSRLGFVFAVGVMALFCYRLIFREEGELAVTQGESYRAYCLAVPRLWPALSARIPAAGNQPRWKDGLKAESWYWGFAVALTAFAATLQFKIFLALVAASLILFWIVSASWNKKSEQ
jgi:protein-S-isoprenylcysteine O-methyltransferase Ste14